jgi:hypothetical protein
MISLLFPSLFLSLSSAMDKPTVKITPSGGSGSENIDIGKFFWRERPLRCDSIGNSTNTSKLTNCENPFSLNDGSGNNKPETGTEAPQGTPPPESFVAAGAGGSVAKVRTFFCKGRQCHYCPSLCGYRDCSWGFVSECSDLLYSEAHFKAESGIGKYGK